MKRKGKQGPRKADGARWEEAGWGRSAYGVFRAWVMGQDPAGAWAGVPADLDRLCGSASRRADWLARIWREGDRGEKERALWVCARLVPDEAGAFFRGVMASGEASLWEQERARELLREVDPPAGAGQGDVPLDRARECVELVLASAGPGTGGGGGAPREAFLGLPAGLQGAVAAELLERDPDRATAFLEGALAEREALWEAVLPPLALAPHPGAAALIREGYRRTQDRMLRKKMKKLNHQRRARGLPAVPLEGDEGRRGVWRPPTPVPPAGFMSVSGGGDERMVCVTRQNVPRGVLVCTAWLHDGLGMRNCLVLDLSRTEAEKYRESVLRNPDLPVVVSDPAYCAHLLETAYKRGAPQAEEEAEAYRRVRMWIKELMPPGEAAPAHPVHVLFPGGGEAAGAVDPLRQDAGLLDHPLLRNWRLDPVPLETHLEKLEEIANSRIILQPMQKRERTDAFYRQVAADAFSSPETRLRWRARADDAAWVLVQRGDEETARRLVRIARGLEEPGREIERQPFWLALVRRTMEAWMERRRAAARQSPSLIVKPS